MSSSGQPGRSAKPTGISCGGAGKVGAGGVTSGGGAGVTTGAGGVVGAAGTVGPVGTVAHPASSATTATDRRAPAPRLQSRLTVWLRDGDRAIGNSIMGWILLEAAVALAIGLFIVWWTWPKRK